MGDIYNILLIWLIGRNNCVVLCIVVFLSLSPFLEELRNDLLDRKRHRRVGPWNMMLGGKEYPDIFFPSLHWPMSIA